jgi:hypothetical protein
MNEAKPAAALGNASQNSTNPAPTFTLFPKLPTEIRIMIWRLTIQPRVLERKFDNIKGFYFTINYLVTLELCRDSRQAVIQSYSLCFGSAFYPASTRINFSFDTLCLDHDFDHIRLFLVGLKDEELSRIRYVAIDELLEFLAEEESNYSDIDLLPGIARSLEAMKALKEVIEV